MVQQEKVSEDKMIVLASASPRRRELLKYITADFVTVPSKVEEIVPLGLTPPQSVEYLAKIKAEDISKQYSKDIVIGADTIVVAEGKVLNKPQSYEECVEMITLLSGKTHNVYTGVAIVKDGKTHTFFEQTEVTFYKLSNEEIAAYADTKEPYDKAGGYGIQGGGAMLVHSINGDYYNVIGLPVAKLSRVLKAI
ncbi:MAG: Maf family protein [Oscillospiraceae bacterium]